jgi:hypothetical protein
MLRVRIPRPLSAHKQTLTRVCPTSNLRQYSANCGRGHFAARGQHLRG